MVLHLWFQERHGLDAAIYVLVFLDILPHPYHKLPKAAKVGDARVQGEEGQLIDAEGHRTFLVEVQL